jgi:hypothetical protein
MLDLLQTNRQAIADLCRQFNVVQLDVFGSAATDEYDAQRSDIDLLVRFAADQSMGPWLGHYFEFRDALQDLLGRPIDLVMASAPRNPYFIREMNRTRRPLYAA